MVKNPIFWPHIFREEPEMFTAICKPDLPLSMAKFGRLMFGDLLVRKLAMKQNAEFTIDG